MAESFDPNNPNGHDAEGQTPEERPSDMDAGQSVPIEAEDGVELEAPRRLASAEFEVDSSVTSEVALREAMDPANQSLTDALRLSYRVLQLVMVVLLILFFTSGVQTVETNQSGVFTRFGKIMTVNGQESLAPGIQPTIWPYPIGEFVLFDVENRNVDLGTVFWPELGGRTLEQAVELANTNDMLLPGRDGTVLTRDGDIAHIKLTAEYEIVDTVPFVKNVPEMYDDRVPDISRRSTPEDAADKMVKVALERSIVRVAATLSLQEFIEPDEATREEIRTTAQEILTRLDTGIRIKSIEIPDAIPPLSIKKVFGELQDKKLQADSMIERARQTAEETLLGAAGEYYGEVIDMIRNYEVALNAGDEARSTELLTAIHDLIGSERISGDAARIVAFAEDYSSQVEKTLGSEAQRFTSLLESYRKQPELVIKREWLEVYEDIYAANDIEVFHMPAGMGEVRMSISGLNDVAETRRKNMLDYRERVARTTGLEALLDFNMLRSDQITLPGKAGRQFQVEGGSLRNTYDRGN